MSDENQQEPDVTEAQSQAEKQILSIMASVKYSAFMPEGSTTIIVTGMIEGIYPLASESYTCMNPEEFDVEKGKQIAIAKCEQSCIKNLWELESYAAWRMRRTMNILGMENTLVEHGMLKDEDRPSKQH